MTIAGIKIKFHYSILLLGALITWQSWSAFPDPISGLLAGGIISALLCAIVIVHEMAHMLMARHLGYHEADTITLWGLGGMAQIPGLQHATPMEEFKISIAGPLSNVALAALGLIVSYVTGISWLSTSELWAPFILTYFVWYNILLGVFNMVPAFPMDGGRVMRAGLSMFMPSFKATKISVIIAKVFAALFVIGGLYMKSILLPLIGVYVWFVSSAELKHKQGMEVRRTLSDMLFGRKRF